MSIGTWLIVAGIVLIGVGIIANSGWLAWFGRLPGDIRLERDNMRIYFPLVSMIVVSVIISLVIYLVSRFWK